MTQNDNLSKKNKKIIVQCKCGKKIAVLPKHSGKQFKCPDCGDDLVVPKGRYQPDSNTEVMVKKNDEELESGDVFFSRRRIIIISVCCSIGLIIIGGFLYLLHNEMSKQKEINELLAILDNYPSVEDADKFRPPSRSELYSYVINRLDVIVRIRKLGIEDIAAEKLAKIVRETSLYPSRYSRARCFKAILLLQWLLPASQKYLPDVEIHLNSKDSYLVSMAESTCAVIKGEKESLIPKIESRPGDIGENAIE